jgi:hypothetical protein
MSTFVGTCTSLILLTRDRVQQLTDGANITDGGVYVYIRTFLSITITDISATYIIGMIVFS